MADPFAATPSPIGAYDAMMSRRDSAGAGAGDFGVAAPVDPFAPPASAPAAVDPFSTPEEDAAAARAAIEAPVLPRSVIEREHYKDKLIAFYSDFNPAKIAEVDAILDLYRGREELLLQQLHDKYGVSEHPEEGVKPAGEPEPDPHEVFRRIVDGLKFIYSTKLKPVEETYDFEGFYSPLLRDSDFESKPMVLLLGQYSTGKTSFIRYMLGREFPGIRIGPEPTTDRFVAVMHGPEDRCTPGNAVAVAEDKPFRALTKFGTKFLNKFECSELPAPILEKLSFVDTPGVLAGEKQRIGRQYDFPRVIEWFATRADRILLLFDAHKLDVSDEFKRAISALKGHDDKIRVVLNKADMVTNQQLMRVYGAMMWSLGKVVGTPEVPRVYIGSFWDKPLASEENRVLLEAEEADLMADLRSLPRNSAVRKINELVKRARLCKVHACLLSELRAQMPMMFGKDKKKKELLDNLMDVYRTVQRKYHLPPGDFPNVERFRRMLEKHDFYAFAKYNERLLAGMDEVLLRDIPELLKLVPQARPDVDDGDEEEKNPFGAEPSSRGLISEEERERYEAQFARLKPVDGRISGAAAKPVLVATGLGTAALRTVWKQSDIDKDGYLDIDEFTLAMTLIKLAKAADGVVPSLTEEMVPATKKDAWMASLM
eukprot:PLAT3024.1.p1 GENE.PLAT3024.1~~PLAT3024.1.p1  ORF type:complete len:655 (-),score=279.59 PLAT3024.1:103-2067(-)